MTPELANRLRDARRACIEIEWFTSGKTLENMWKERSLQLSLHKLLEIVGEALNQASKIDPDIESDIPNLRRFVGVRNQITHGYDSVDYAVVWQISKERIPPLLEALDKLLGPEPGEPPSGT